MSISFFWSQSQAFHSRDQGGETASQTAQCTLLDFVILAATLDIRIYKADYVKLRSINTRHDIGEGAVSAISLGERKGNIVAVKESRVASKPLSGDKADYRRYVAHVLRELRILALKRIKDHPNIVQLLSFGIERSSNTKIPHPFLVLEYSDLGTLDVFLHTQPTISTAEQIAFCLDVASALEALHSMYICHGDVKLGNILVFTSKRSEGRIWIAKLADFNQAIIGDAGSIDARVCPSPGTILVNAPEIRQESAFRDEAFNIKSALLTDIFSYGLLVWEILNNGRNYLECTACGESGVEQKEEFLNTFQEDGLLECAVSFLDENHYPEKLFRLKIEAVFAATLRDDPSKRQSISASVQILAGGDALETIAQPYKEDSYKQNLAAFATLPDNVCLFELLDEVSLGDILSSNVKSAIVEDLQVLAASEDRQSISKAAMMLSDCHILGFGARQSMESALEWLHVAAIHGNYRAQAWYYRLWLTLKANPPPMQPFLHSERVWEIETKLLDIPEPSYFSHRIRSYTKDTCSRTEQYLYASEVGSFNPQSGACLENMKSLTLSLETFAQGEFDELDALHWCAWLNCVGLATSMTLGAATVNSTTPRGRTPLFYACLGGHFPMVKTLCEKGADASIRDDKGISTLHLAIMFEENDAEEAVRLLLHNGADPEASIAEPIRWETHDLVLESKPLEWAVQTRNLGLSKCLLQHRVTPCGLHLAINSRFPEITDVLLTWSERLGLHVDIAACLDSIKRPYSYWLAHGKEHLSCINSTFQVLEKHGHSMKDSVIGEVREEGCSALIFMIVSARMEEDIYTIQQMIVRGVDTKVKTGFFDPLTFAVGMDDGNVLWEPVLDLLLQQYSQKELNSTIEGHNYLHTAIGANSVLATRLMLEHGADPNYVLLDETRCTPLRTCLQVQASPEIFRLLLDYGAEHTEPDELLMRSVGLEMATDYFYEDGLFLDAVLNTGLSHLQILQRSFENAVCRKFQESIPISVLRYLLQHEAVKPLINYTVDGFGLIHRAAWELDLELTMLLLEAGAKCDGLCNPHRQTLSPLHLVLARSRYEWKRFITGQATISEMWETKRQSAMRLASLLLAQYHVTQNDLFKSITDLHLAAYMNDLESIEGLIRSGADVHSKGIWPVENHAVTPRELFLGSVACLSPYFITSHLDRPVDTLKMGMPEGLHDRYQEASRYLDALWLILEEAEDPVVSEVIGGQPVRILVDHKKLLEHSRKILDVLYAAERITEVDEILSESSDRESQCALAKIPSKSSHP